MQAVKDKPKGYLDNEKFTQAIIDYVTKRKEAADAGKEIPQISNYIGESFWNIATGLTYNKKFIANHSIRDELIDHAVENCIKAIHNFKAGAATRGGKPNAFGYFTMVCYNAFLRRCMMEKHEQHVRNEIIERLSFDYFVDLGPDGDPTEAIQILESIRNSRDHWRASTGLDARNDAKFDHENDEHVESSKFGPRIDLQKEKRVRSNARSFAQ